MLKFSSHRGFSILMALGVTAVLMIVVTGLAAMYARELKISRLSYDEVLVQASAEGMFEYGMLKKVNHAAGFQDSVFLKTNDVDSDLDSGMFKLSSKRSEGLQMNYEMTAKTKEYNWKIEPFGFLSIPLFVADCDVLTRPENCKPDKNTNAPNIKDIKVTGLNSNSSWIISAMNGSESVALQGVGDITNTTEGYIELRAFKCSYVNISGNVESFDSDISCDLANNSGYNSADADKKEELMYAYQIPKITITKFLNEEVPKLGKNTFDPATGFESKQETQMERKFPYLTIYNNSSTALDINIESNGYFASPEYSIKATAKKGDASQVFTLSQDKGSEMELLKYGYYGNTTP